MNPINRKTLDYNYLLIAGVTAIVLIPFLGKVHLFDWDEINFAESAREMLISGDFLDVQINFIAFWEKPPLFIWMQVASMKIFGINEFAARFPNAVCGIATLLILYHVGKKRFNRKFGLIWVLVYISSILPFFYFKSGIIDPWFNFFIFLSIHFFIKYVYTAEVRTRWWIAALSGLLLGLAVLTKGPVAILLFGITILVFLIIKRFKFSFSTMHLVLFTFALILSGGFWFLLQIITGNSDVILKFITYQIELFQTKGAGHGGFPGYHFVVIIFGVFPASIFALAMLKQKTSFNDQQRGFQLIMTVLAAVVLIVFTIVKTKIVHYSSLTYFPVTFLAACYIQGLFEKKWQTNNFVKFSTVIVGLAVAISLLLLTLIGQFKEKIIASDLIKDPFAVANLEANVRWSGFEIVIGIILIFGIIYFAIATSGKKDAPAIYGLFVSSFLFINLSLLFVAPKIESYSQKAAIDFYQDIKNEDAYILPMGFKTYGHYFYAQIKAHENINYYNKEWLLEGKVDKPVYVICKIHHLENLMQERPNLELLYSKNGFAFLKRKLNQQL